MKKLFHNHYLCAFWTTLGVALSLMIGSFFCPPMGAIDGSVLAAVGELFLWPTLAFAVKALQEGKTAQIRKGETEITIGEIKEKEMNED